MKNIPFQLIFYGLFGLRSNLDEKLFQFRVCAYWTVIHMRSKILIKKFVFLVFGSILLFCEIDRFRFEVFLMDTLGIWNEWNANFLNWSDFQDKCQKDLNFISRSRQFIFESRLSITPQIDRKLEAPVQSDKFSPV